MELTNEYQPVKTHSGRALWTGRIISAICIIFLFFDAILKLIRESHAVEGSAQLGWPVHSLLGLGIILLASTILYVIPRTAILGAILLSAYLGGAVATMVRVAEPYYFPLIFGILVWAGLYFRDEKLRALIPFRKEEKFG